MAKHLIWDWNCTLFNDFPAILRASSVTSQALGGPPVDQELYHSTHVRPISMMYERILGREFTEEEFAEIDALFLKEYELQLPDLVLRDDAELCIKRLSASGTTQSILSMWYDDLLTDLLQKFPTIRDAMVFTHGIQLGDVHSKENHIQVHIDEIARRGVSVLPESITMIGDSANDAVAASHAGLQAILVTGGMDSRAKLEEQDVPVVDTLTEALDLFEAG